MVIAALLFLVAIIQEDGIFRAADAEPLANAVDGPGEIQQDLLRYGLILRDEARHRSAVEVLSPEMRLRRDSRKESSIRSSSRWSSDTGLRRRL